jgi:acetylornithine deacetylase/succinyl-diaminopimelate desuccinylase-like protein
VKVSEEEGPYKKPGCMPSVQSRSNDDPPPPPFPAPPPPHLPPACIAPPPPRFGPTRFSVIPRSAVAKVSIRFVPEQDAARLVEALRDHIGREFGKLGSANRVRRGGVCVRQGGGRGMGCRLR